jgi:hypothetical protein
MSREEKNRIATQYQDNFFSRIKEGDQHITHGNDNEQMLHDSLANDDIGMHLSNIESIVSEALAATEPKNGGDN